MVLRMCGVCKTEIDLNEHLSGLVFEDNIFVCSDCCSDPSDHLKNEWSESIMRKSGNGMPISLWLIHEQNKGKPMLSKTKT